MADETATMDWNDPDVQHRLIGHARRSAFRTCPNDQAEDVANAALAAIVGHASGLEHLTEAGWHRYLDRCVATYAKRTGARTRLESAAKECLCTSYPNSTERSEADEVRTEAIATLPPDDRELLIERYCRGWSLRTIGEMHGFTAKQAHKRIARARKELQGRMSKAVA